MICFKTLLAVVVLLLATGGTALADSCNQINGAYSACQLSSMCSKCVATSGCEYNLTDATCTTVSASNKSAIYCSSSDSICASCTVSSTKPTCLGEDDSCICLSLCDIVSSTSSSDDCSSTITITPTTSNSQGFSMMHAAAVLGALCIAIMLYMQRKCREQRMGHHIGLTQEIEARRQQHLREREMLRESRSELALNLETWRNHVEMHKPQISKVELEMCYYLMMQDDDKNSKKGGSQLNRASEGEVKVGIGATHSPIFSGVSDPRSLQSSLPMTAPYFAMREEYPSNTTTDGCDSESEFASIADEDEEKAEDANDVER